MTNYYISVSDSSAATRSPIAVLDKQGDIVGVNRAWNVFGKENGLPEEYTTVGKNYVEISQQAGNHVATKLRRLLSNEVTEFTVIYPCHAPNQRRWFRLYASAVSVGNDRYYVLVHQRLDQGPPSGQISEPEVTDASRTDVDHRDRSRLVTYSLSSDGSAIEGVVMAFDAIGIDVESRTTTLQDWINPDVIHTIKTSTSDVHLTFLAWNYPVGLTPEKVTIYTPERSSEQENI